MAPKQAVGESLLNTFILAGLLGDLESPFLNSGRLPDKHKAFGSVSNNGRRKGAKLKNVSQYLSIHI